MVTFKQVVELEQQLRETPVLSVFLPQVLQDPAQRHGWRVALNDAIRGITSAQEAASHEERGNLAAALEQLEHEIERIGGRVSTSGWIGYIGAGRTWLASPLRITPPLLVHWGLGIRVAPLLPALHEPPPVAVGIVESGNADVYRWDGAELTRVDTLHAHAHTEPVTHMGATPRQGFHSGTRGRTGHDQAERERLVGHHRMVRTLVERLTEVAGPRGWILLGGAPAARHDAWLALANRGQGAARELAELHLGATPFEVAQRVADGVKRMQDDADERRVEAVLDASAAGGRGVCGISPTLSALSAGVVNEVLLSAQLVTASPMEAERVVGKALQAGVRVTCVSARAAELLDARAGGVASERWFASPTSRPASGELTSVEGEGT